MKKNKSLSKSKSKPKSKSKSQTRVDLITGSTRKKLKNVHISLVIPAYNEADYLPDTLNSVYEAIKQFKGTVEVIVVDDNSTDATSVIAQMFGAIVVFEPINQIAKARNTGARAASGKYLIFLDADTTIHGDIFAKVFNCLSSGKIIGGGAWTEPNSSWFGRFVFKYFINYVLALKNVTVGPFLYCERKAFKAVGGFDEELYAAEEFSLAKRLKEYGQKQGKKWHIIKHHKGHRIITSNRKFENYGGLEMVMCNAHLLIGTNDKLRHKDQCDFWYKPH